MKWNEVAVLIDNGSMSFDEKRHFYSRFGDFSENNVYGITFIIFLGH